MYSKFSPENNMKFKQTYTWILLLLLLAGCSKDPTDDGGSSVNKSANLRSLGASANELLSDEKFTSINIEIVYVSGYEPEQSTLDNLIDYLEKRIYKPDGIKISKRAVPSSNEAPFEIEEIVAIEAEERLTYNAGDEIAVFIYFADGSNEGDTDSKVILGSAYRNTSMVIYGKTVKKIANRMNSTDKGIVESTVVNHEFGHLFGLVDVGTAMQTNHEDPDSNAHCNVSGCLMNANLEFGSGVVDVLDNNGVPPMDDFCIMDLRANGGR